ncbi:hypothetical protein [Rhodococcus sp. NPDC058514]|uniref:hypothetical protein n=1 Tax=unclassified Rhodococcus (in: high G+C Gram-positive bacteria) TaxID=192944 RepID=UPI0036639989
MWRHEAHTRGFGYNGGGETPGQDFIVRIQVNDITDELNAQKSPVGGVAAFTDEYGSRRNYGAGEAGDTGTASQRK